MSPDFIEQEAAPGQGRGLAGVRDIVRMLRTAFPDLQAAIEDPFSVENRTCARLRFRSRSTS